MHVEDFECFFGVGGAENQQTVVGGGIGGAIAVVDIDVGIGQLMGNPSQGARLVVALDHKHLGCNGNGIVFFKDAHRAFGVAHDHADHVVIHCVSGTYGVYIDFFRRQGIAQACKGARVVFQKNGDLFG